MSAWSCSSVSCWGIALLPNEAGLSCLRLVLCCIEAWDAADIPRKSDRKQAKQQQQPESAPADAPSPAPSQTSQPSAHTSDTAAPLLPEPVKTPARPGFGATARGTDKQKPKRAAAGHANGAPRLEEAESAQSASPASSVPRQQPQPPSRPSSTAQPTADANSGAHNDSTTSTAKLIQSKAEGGPPPAANALPSFKTGRAVEGQSPAQKQHQAQGQAQAQKQSQGEGQTQAQARQQQPRQAHQSNRAAPATAAASAGRPVTNYSAAVSGLPQSTAARKLQPAAVPTATPAPVAQTPAPGNTRRAAAAPAAGVQRLRQQQQQGHQKKLQQDGVRQQAGGTKQQPQPPPPPPPPAQVRISVTHHWPS